MSERLLDKLYIGIDLKEESAMLSYFHPGMERPATVSFVAGSSEYSLPLVVAKRHGIGQWVYGKDAERLAEAGQGTKAENLFRQALNKNGRVQRVSGGGSVPFIYKKNLIHPE